MKKEQLAKKMGKNKKSAEYYHKGSGSCYKLLGFYENDKGKIVKVKPIK
jgi:hypothetical protein